MGEPLRTDRHRPMDAISEPLFTFVPAGEFLMGTEEGQDEERPIHCVYVCGFEFGIFQVRNRDYQSFVTSSGYPAPPFWGDPGFDDPEQPVVAVSWFDAVAYCEWLGKVTHRIHRLPTEAEWERAARGHREGSRYPWGNASSRDWPDYVRRWIGGVQHPLVVGTGTPNDFGLYDICENVHEWCSDWFCKNYYSESPASNPQGPASGERRSSRGGSWRHQIKVSRCAARSSIPPGFRYSDYGFRVVREATQ